MLYKSNICIKSRVNTKMYFFFKSPSLDDKQESNILNSMSMQLAQQFFLITLTASDWDDYGYKTDFTIWINNLKTGIKLGLGTLKVAYLDQIDSWTIENPKLKDQIIERLDSEFFSMFTSEDSYHAVWKYFGDEYENLLQINEVDQSINKKDFIRINAIQLFESINDISFSRVLREENNSISELDVFKNSFLRSTSLDSILHNYEDAAHQRAGVTQFLIKLKNIEFRSELDSFPSTNIHALIGSNGGGKSHILDQIVEGYKKNKNEDNRVRKVIIVSFSPFDKLASYKEYLLYPGDIKINYIGLKDFYIHINNIDRKIYEKLKSREELENDFINNFYLAIKKDLLLVNDIFKTLNESHPNSLLHEVHLDEIIDIENNRIFIEFKKKESGEPLSSESSHLIKSAQKTEAEISNEFINKQLSDEKIKKDNIIKFRKLSSGYQIIMYTLLSLVAHLERGNLVLYDEPEVYLHPPLLLTYIKLLREVLTRKNGIGIFATHSPILLQEIPQHCVKVIKGINSDGKINSSEVRSETYASSISTINNEIFKLETINTGFYKEILTECGRIEQENKNLDEEEKINILLTRFNDSIGEEGLSIAYDFFYKDES